MLEHLTIAAGIICMFIMNYAMFGDHFALESLLPNLDHFNQIV